MEHQIFIREAVTESEIARFFGELHTYHRRDIFPETEQAEDLAYFLSDGYLSQLKTLHRRQENRLHIYPIDFEGRLQNSTLALIWHKESALAPYKRYLMDLIGERFAAYQKFEQRLE